MSEYPSRRWSHWSFEETFEAINHWAAERGIYTQGTQEGQLSKMAEELKELKDAWDLNVDSWSPEDWGPEVVEETGDVGVTWLVWCQMNKLDPVACLQLSLEKIRQRQGKMEQGVFVKDPRTHNHNEHGKGCCVPEG